MHRQLVRADIGIKPENGLRVRLERPVEQLRLVDARNRAAANRLGEGATEDVDHVVAGHTDEQVGFRQPRLLDEQLRRRSVALDDLRVEPLRPLDGGWVGVDNAVILQSTAKNRSEAD